MKLANARIAPDSGLVTSIVGADEADLEVSVERDEIRVVMHRRNSDDAVVLFATHREVAAVVSNALYDWAMRTED